MTSLTAKKRDKATTGKKYAKEIRSNGLVPAVIYGDKKEPISITLDPVQFLKELNQSDFKKNQIFEISIDENIERVITKEINVNPINNQFIHIDFQRVKDDVSLVVNIPVKVNGISAGQRLGGVLVKPQTTVKIKCLPNEIPVNIEIDVTELKIGENFRVNEIELQGSQSILSNPKDILVKVESTKVSKTATAEPGQDEAQTESNGNES
tara:strand:+ start:2535 stop:3161 length:627 start_codon:yes stop_codon:yes gene_type:complete